MNQTRFASLLAGNIIYRILNIVLNILITLLLTRLLKIEGYGLLSLLIANVAIFNLITCLGADSALTYHHSKGDIRPSKLFSILYLIIIFQAGLLILAELIYYSSTGKHLLLDEQGVFALICGMGYFLSVIISDKYIALLNGAHQYTLANRTLFVANLVSLALLTWAYYFKTEASISFLILLFVSGSICSSIFLVFAFHVIAGNRLVLEKAIWPDWKVFFSYSFIAFFSNVIQFLAYRVDYWIVDYYHGTGKLGLYSLAVKLGQMLWVLPLLFASLILPMVADKNNRHSEHRIFSLIRISNSFLIVITILVALAAGWFIPFFAGAEYHDSVQPFLYLLPGLLFFCVNILLAAYFAGRGLLKINLYGSIICLVVVLVMDFVLIPGYGINGAAIASTIAYSTSSFFLIFQFLNLPGVQATDILLMNRSDLNDSVAYLKKIFQRL